MRKTAGLLLGLLLPLGAIWPAWGQFTKEDIGSAQKLALSAQKVGTVAPRTAAAQPESAIVIPPPTGTLLQLPGPDLAHIAALVREIVGKGKAPPRASSQQWWSFALHGCRAPDGTLNLVPDPDDAAAAFVFRNRVTDYDGEKAKQLMEFSKTAVLLHVDTSMRADGAFTVRRFYFYGGSPYYLGFNVSPSGEILYSSPDQLSAEGQRSLHRSLAFWRGVSPSDLDSLPMRPEAIRFPLACVGKQDDRP